MECVNDLYKLSKPAMPYCRSAAPEKRNTAPPWWVAPSPLLGRIASGNWTAPAPYTTPGPRSRSVKYLAFSNTVTPSSHPGRLGKLRGFSSSCPPTLEREARCHHAAAPGSPKAAAHLASKPSWKPSVPANWGQLLVV